MQIDEMAFFHKGTVTICGSLDMDEVLRDCYEFLKDYMPVNGILMSYFDPEIGGIRIIASMSDINVRSPGSLILLSQESCRFIEAREGNVEIINRADSTPASLEICAALGLSEMSCTVLHLKIRGEILGVVGVYAEGTDLYEEKHARLLKLLHDPMAIAMSNALRYREVLRLKERLRDDNLYLHRELHRISGDEIIGANFGLRNVMEMIRQVAPLDSLVLLQGETGAGKEVLASAIHFSSRRSGGPFIKVNCGAIPENLMDSELFGHEKGAFTGAATRRRGLFERAHKGTLFLDEIGELTHSAQVRLLRVLQNREIQRVGGVEPVGVDVRIVVATHRDLEEMVAEGRFREDLWFRLNVFPIFIPPLRERKEDIPALLNHFIERKVREMKLRFRPPTAPGAVERLQGHDWPGNVREMENAVERELIRSQAAGGQVPLEFREFGGAVLSSREAAKGEKEIGAGNREEGKTTNLDEIVREHIRSVLEKSAGKVQGEDGAAALLGVHPNTLRHRMRKLGIPFGRNA